MSSALEIKNIERLMADKLGPKKKISNVEVTLPPQKGVGSLMLKAKVTVLDEYNDEKDLYLITKRIPPSEYTQKTYEIQVTYKKEVWFYLDVIPALRDFQIKEGVVDIIDYFADFFGARFNLEGKSEVNHDAELLLEDLSVKGVYHWCVLFNIKLGCSNKPAVVAKTFVFIIKNLK